MVSNLSLKAKLRVLVYIMIIILGFFSLNIIYEKYQKKIQLQELKISVELSTYFSKLVHELQKERGFTAGFLGSNATEFVKELQQQQLDTNIQLESFLTYLKQHKIASLLSNKIKQIEDNLNNLSVMRELVQSQSLQTSEALAYYTNANEVILEAVIEISKLSDSPIISQQLNAYINFLLAKERVGIERALGANALANNAFKGDLKNRFVSIIAIQDGFFKSFKDYTTPKELDFFTLKLNTQEVAEVAQMRKVLLEKEQNFGIESSVWFTKITNKINLLKSIDDYLAQNLTQSINEEISTAAQMFITFAIIAISGFLLIIFISFTVTKDILNKIKIFQAGLLNFFSFVNKQTPTAVLIGLTSSDEFGVMSKIVNENIKNTERIINQEQAFLNEVAQVVEKTKQGELTHKLSCEIQSDALNALKISFNDMIATLNKNIANNTNKVLEVLEKFAQFDFRKSIENAYGVIELRLNDVNSLINTMLVNNKANGLTLQLSANTLLQNVEVLSTASNQAAASLEETAAALEEITGNITSNTENIIKMSRYANELTSSANQGEKLANQTNISMDEINEQVEAINDAITVIDQIAFQTNILSLNAAVEAATAGEAGKGFAVVAAEVRNLANRSADAAKEIKMLVENANLKANNGKNIANEMILGYHSLNDNINKTLELIKDIESASKEQQIGIEQINNAVAELDQQTQQNAQVASQTRQIAQSTQRIANNVVHDANEKEFIGKETVTAHDFN
ncbi:MAG: nitrate- and nitrite sensing domain-containing protein [Arcobacteraceae bacterium]